jgi:hypothetical protein
MADTPEFLSERLVADGEKSIDFFNHVPLEDWQQTIYTDGSVWTLHEVLAHFVTAEASLCKLIENIIAGGSGSPEDFDLNLYNNRKVEKLKETTVPDLLAEFKNNRQATAQVVQNLSLQDLERTGRHPYLGIAPLAEIIKIIYRHNQIHIREIRKILTKAE